MRQALFLIGVIASLLGALRPASAELSVTRGESALLSAFPVTDKIDFSGTPQSAILAPMAGGFAGITYYSELVFKNVRIHATFSNGNFPGIVRTANWCAFPQWPDLCSFYNPRGDAIHTGVTFTPYEGKGLGVDFRRLGGVNGVGFRFGTLSASIPCCVRQYVKVHFSDGSSTIINLGAALGTESGYNDFTSIISNGLPITHLEFVQVGLDAIIDDVTWAPASPAPEPCYAIVKTGPITAPPQSQLRLCVSASSAAASKRLAAAAPAAGSCPAIVADECAALKATKGPNCETSKNADDFAKSVALVPSEAVTGRPADTAKALVVNEAIKTVRPKPAQDIMSLIMAASSYLKDRVTGPAAYFISNASIQLSFGSRFNKRQCDDPPDMNYQTLVKRSGKIYNAGFQTLFGSAYKPADAAFKNLSFALESFELALISIERSQGAIVAKNNLAFQRQADAAAAFFMDADKAIQESEKQIALLWEHIGSDDHIIDTKFDPKLLKSAQLFLKQNGVPGDTRRLLRNKFGMSEAAIKNVVKKVSNLTAADVGRHSDLSFKRIGDVFNQTIESMKYRIIVAKSLSR